MDVFADLLGTKNGDCDNFDIQGNFENYIAGETLGKGDFVSLHTNVRGYSTVIAETTGIKSGTHVIRVTELAENTFFVTLSVDNANKQIGAVVAKIDSRGNITHGTPVTIDTGKQSVFGCDIVRVSATKVIVTYQSDNTNYYLKCAVCIISGTSITIVSRGTKNSTVGSGYYLATANLNATQFITFHSSDNSSYYQQFTISSFSTPTTVDYTIKNSIINMGYYCAVAQLEKNKFVVGYLPSDNWMPRFVIGYYTGSQIVFGNIIQCPLFVSQNSNNKWRPQIIPLTAKKVLVLARNYSSTASTAFISGWLLNVNGNNLTISATKTDLAGNSGVGGPGWFFTASAISSNCVLLFHLYDPNEVYRHLYLKKLSIYENTISTTNLGLICNDTQAALNLRSTINTSRTCFCAHSNSNGGVMGTWVKTNVLKDTTVGAEPNILGVSDEDCTANEEIEVYRPKGN